MALLRRELAVVLASILMASGLVATPSPAQQSGASDDQAEYNVKAAFLYHFGRYVEWPHEVLAEPDAPFVIGILGETPLAEILEDIAARKTIAGRRIVLRKYASAAEFRPPCHMLFVSRSLSPEQQADAVRAAQGVGVLSVGEAQGFAERGGIIHFVVDGGHVRFEINVEGAKRARLRMDAKLLSLGRRPQDGPPSPDGRGRNPVASQTASPP